MPDVGQQHASPEPLPIGINQHKSGEEEEIGKSGW
jgi:hypothetical protein